MAAITFTTPNPVRASYVNLFQPRAVNGGDKKEYSVTLLIPKTDTESYNSLMAAFKAAAEAAAAPQGAWRGKRIPNPKTTLYDGDQPNPHSGEPWGPECKGMWILRTKAGEKSKPVVTDEYNKVISDPDMPKSYDPNKVYAGCWVYAMVGVGGYNTSGNMGIGSYINGVMFAKDDEPLGGKVDVQGAFAGFAKKPSAPDAGSANPFGVNPFG